MPKEERDLLVDHLTLKDPLGDQALLLTVIRKRRYKDHSRDEFKNAKPPTFNGEVKSG